MHQCHTALCKGSSPFHLNLAGILFNLTASVHDSSSNTSQRQHFEIHFFLGKRVGFANEGKFAHPTKLVSKILANPHPKPTTYLQQLRYSLLAYALVKWRTPKSFSWAAEWWRRHALSIFFAMRRTTSLSASPALNTSSLLSNLANCSAACRTLSTAQTLIAGLPRTTAIALDVSSVNPQLESQIAAHDLVISLVPYVYHATIIRIAIKHRVNVVTTRYISDAIRELDGSAREAGIVVLNEVGVDPGVDHLYAVKKIGEVHAKGGKVGRSRLFFVCVG